MHTNHQPQPADTWTAWDVAVTRVVGLIDPVVRFIGELPGRVLLSRRRCSAGVFFNPSNVSWWGAWVEPGAFNLRLGRVEVQIDRPTLDAA